MFLSTPLHPTPGRMCVGSKWVPVTNPSQAILTFIVYGGGIALTHYSPDNFFRIGFLIGYIFSIIFWLSGWAWSASLAGVWLSAYDSYTRAGYRVSNSDPGKQLGAALAVCAALGAVVWYVFSHHIPQRPSTS
jgi:hypothetical protein